MAQLLRRKEVYLTDNELSFFKADCIAHGMDSRGSKEHMENILRAYMTSKGGKPTAGGKVSFTTKIALK